MKQIFILMEEWWSQVVIGVIVSFTVVAIVYIVKKIREISLYKLAIPFLQSLDSAGLVSAHSSTNSSMKSIKDSLANSDTLRILSNKGTDWFGADTVGLSSDIEQRANRSLDLRCILLDENAPWLEEWTDIRANKELEKRKAVFKAAHNSVEAFILENKEKFKNGLNVRYHKETPCWRIIITDARLFISSYASKTDAREEIVLEFKGPNTPIYDAYHRYFEFLWHKRSKPRGAVSERSEYDNKFSSFRISAGVVATCKTQGTFFVLAMVREDGKLSFPKGGVEHDESIQDAACREAKSEAGLEITNKDKLTPIGWFPNFIEQPDGTTEAKFVFYFGIMYETETFPELKVGAEHKSASWFDVEKLSEDRFAYDHAKNILATWVK